MKKVAIFVSIISWSVSLFAQHVETIFQEADKFSIKNFDSCYSLCHEGLKLATDLHDVVYVASFKTILGKAYYFKGQYDSAAFYYNESISTLEHVKTNEKLGFTYNELAKLYRRTKKFDKSLVNYEKALQVYKALNDSMGIGMIYNESGVVYELMENYEAALARYKLSYEMAVRRNDNTGQAYALNFIGNINSLQQNFIEAELAFRKSIELHTTLHDTFAIGWCNLDFANHLKKAQKYDQANETLLIVEQIATSLHLPDLLSKVYFIRSEIDSAQGHETLSLLYFKKYTSLKDSLFNTDNNKLIEELNTKYESTKKESLIQVQKEKLQRKNIILLALIVSVLLLGLLAISFFKRKKIENEKKLQAEIMYQQDIATKAVIEAEEKERQRIAADLHDGIGQLLSAAKMNLHAVDDYFIDKEKQAILEKAIYLVDESAKEIRSVSHNIMPNALIKSGLGFAVKDFIEKLDNKKIQVNVNTVGLNEKLNSNIEIVVYRIIQECVNNVIKHAKANRLDISLMRESETLDITIEDNGVGFDVEKALNLSGIGLKNIMTRVEYLKGTIDIDSRIGNGTVLAIHIPLDQSSNETKN